MPHLFQALFLAELCKRCLGVAVDCPNGESYLETPPDIQHIRHTAATIQLTTGESGQIYSPKISLFCDVVQKPYQWVYYYSSGNSLLYRRASQLAPEWALENDSGKIANFESRPVWSMFQTGQSHFHKIFLTHAF